MCRCQIQLSSSDKVPYTHTFATVLFRGVTWVHRCTHRENLNVNLFLIRILEEKGGKREREREGESERERGGGISTTT